MQRSILDIIQNTEENFRLAIYDNEISLKNVNDIYRIFLASLINDYFCNPEIFFRLNDIVELEIVSNNITKIGRFIYKGVENKKPFPQIKLQTGDNNNTIYYINAQESWRLKKIPELKKVGKKIQITSKEIQIFNKAESEKITSEWFNRVSKDTQIPITKLFSFKRTIIILFTKNGKDFVKHDYYESGISKLLQIGVIENGKITDINNENYLKTNRGINNNIIFVNSKNELIRFINDNFYEKFLIITDKIEHFYKETHYSEMNDLLKFKIKLLILPNFDDLRIFLLNNSDLSNAFFELIITEKSYNKDFRIKDHIIKVENKEIDKLFREIEIKSKELANVYDKYGKLVKKLLWTLFKQLDKIQDEDEFIDSINTEIELADNIRDILRGYIRIFNKHNNKMEILNDLTKNNSEYYIYYGLQEIPELVGHCKKLHSIREIENQYSMNVLFYFLDYMEFKNWLIPFLKLNKNKHIVKFLLYEAESRILLNTFYDFTKKLLGFEIIENEYEENIKHEEMFFETNFLDEISVGLSVSNNVKLQGEDQLVKVKTLYFYDNDNNRYYAYLTDKYKAYLLNREIEKIEINNVKVDDVLIFFGDEGVHNIIEKYPELCYNNIEEHKTFLDWLRLRNIWTYALKKYINKHSCMKLYEEMIKYDIEINLNMIERWSQDEVLIAPKDKKMLKVLAEIFDDEAFKKNNDEIIIACENLKNLTRRIGKLLKKIALYKFGSKDDEFMSKFNPKQRELIEEIMQKMLLLTVVKIDDSYCYVDRSMSNKANLLNNWG